MGQLPSSYEWRVGGNLNQDADLLFPSTLRVLQCLPSLDVVYVLDSLLEEASVPCTSLTLTGRTLSGELGSPLKLIGPEALPLRQGSVWPWVGGRVGRERGMGARGSVAQVDHGPVTTVWLVCVARNCFRKQGN